MEQYERDHVAMQLFEQAEKLMKLADEFRRPIRSREVDLQAVADTMRDAGRHAMKEMIRRWLHEFNSECGNADMSRREIDEWFEKRLGRAEASAAQFATMHRMLFDADSETLQRRALTEIDWPDRCGHGFHNSQSTCQLDRGHLGPHSSIRY